MALHGPQSTSIPAPVSLCRRAERKPLHPSNLTHFRNRCYDIGVSFTPLLLKTFEVPLVRPVTCLSLSLCPMPTSSHRIWRNRHSLQVHLQTQSFQACCLKRWNERRALQRKKKMRRKDGEPTKWGVLLHSNQAAPRGNNRGGEAGVETVDIRIIIII